jgi:hypothetical protein
LGFSEKNGAQIVDRGAHEKATDGVSK